MTPISPEDNQPSWTADGAPRDGGPGHLPAHAWRRQPRRDPAADGQGEQQQADSDFGQWGTPEQALGRGVRNANSGANSGAVEEPGASKFGDWGDADEVDWVEHDERQTFGRGGKLVMIAGMSAITFCIILAIWYGAPVLGRSASVIGLVPLVVAAGGGMLWWRTYRRSTGLGFWYTVIAVGFAAIILGSFSWGLVNSVVVDGKLYLATSDTANAYALLQELDDNRELYVQVDELLNLDPAGARARFREFEPLTKQVQAVSDRWSLQKIDELPSGDFVPAIDQSRAAAYFAALALERKQTLLGAQDARVAAELEAARVSFTQSAISMAGYMGTIAKNYGFEWQ